MPKGLLYLLNIYFSLIFKGFANKAVEDIVKSLYILLKSLLI